MSRVGKRLINIPKNVEVKIAKNAITVKGTLGELSFSFSPLICVKQKDETILVSRANEEKHTKQLHGTTNALIANMLKGVSEGYKKEIEIKGVGYRASLKGTSLEVLAGYSHPFILEIPKELKLELPSQTEIVVKGIDKQKVGHFASIIRDIRRPNPYSGKGIMYKNEKIRRKEGKAASK